MRDAVLIAKMVHRFEDQIVKIEAVSLKVFEKGLASLEGISYLAEETAVLVVEERASVRC